MNIPLKRYWSLLVGYLRPQRARVAIMALALVGGIALELLNPQVLRYFIDTATAGGATESLMIAALLFIGMALAKQALSICATYMSENVSWTATNALRADLAAHCLRLDLSFHKAHTPGELIERIDGDVDALANFFSRLVIDVLSNLALLIGVLVLLFLEDWHVGLAMSLFALIALVVLVRLRSVAVPHWAAVREASATFFGFLGEQLAGTEDIRSSGAGGYVMRRFYTLLRGWLPLTRQAGLAMYAMWATTILLFAAGNALAFALGATLWSAGTITIGTVYLIFQYTELLRRPIEDIRSQMQDLQKAGASIGRVEELLLVSSRLQEGAGLAPPAGALSVEFQGVSFGYEEEPRTENQHANKEQRTKPALSGGERNKKPGTEDQEPRTEDVQAQYIVPLPLSTGDLVLRDISFRLEPGQVLGLLGRTGSGKTSLARLLLRLYDPRAGTICLGGVPIRAAPLAQLRSRVKLVTQDVQLFHATVRDNLTFFNRAISDERIIGVLHDLGLGGWLKVLPLGLDTELESGGSGLSAGEAQLLAFVRVFLADPGLVILDEASSRLDPATEQAIERAVDRLLAGRTGIIIAHRLATVQRADQIMILERGHILEYGERRRLAEDPHSRFAGLLRTGLEEVLA